MKTDHPIYLFLSAGAEAFRVLSGGLKLVGPYSHANPTTLTLRVAVFAPLVIRDDTELRARASTLWHTVRQAPLPTEACERLSEVLEFWFFERFRDLTAKEIWAMLNLITPIEETRACQ